MKNIEGKKYKLAGFKVETSAEPDLSRVFAVFATKDCDVENLPRQSPSDILRALEGKAEPQKVFKMDVQELTKAVVSFDQFVDSTREGIASNSHLKPLVRDLGEKKLAEVLREFSKVRLPAPNPTTSYYIPVKGKIQSENWSASVPKGNKSEI